MLVRSNLSEHHWPRPPAGWYCRLGPSKDVKLIALSSRVDGLVSQQWSIRQTKLKKCLFPSLGFTICSFICNIVVLNLNYHAPVSRAAAESAFNSCSEARNRVGIELEKASIEYIESSEMWFSCMNNKCAGIQGDRTHMESPLSSCCRLMRIIRGSKVVGQYKKQEIIMMNNHLIKHRYGNPKSNAAAI